MTKEQFSTLDIVRILNIPRERLRDWMNRGFIVPEIQRANGPGTKNIFSCRDIQQIKQFIMLIELGLSRKVAAKCSRDDDELIRLIDNLEGAR